MAIKKSGCFEYADDVEFAAALSEYDNCECNGCHNLARVYKIRYPHTLYHDGKRLTTKYYSYWLCESCAEKLRKAIGDAARGLEPGPLK